MLSKKVSEGNINYNKTMFLSLWGFTSESGGEKQVDSFKPSEKFMGDPGKTKKVELPLRRDIYLYKSTSPNKS